MTPMQALLSAFLAAIAVGGFGYVFAYPLLSGERKAERNGKLPIRPPPPRER